MLIHRDVLEKIESWLFKQKVLIIYGARQVGKTTLAETLIEKHKQNAIYYNCERLSVQQALEKEEPEELKRFLGNAKLVVLDEAQVIPNIGKKLKLLIDTYPDTQIIATGSSSFDLANQIGEPLTGRSITFTLYPFSAHELTQIYKGAELDNQLDWLLRFGSYPEVVTSGEERTTRDILDNISSNYLYKDILAFENIKKSDLLKNLLQLLALQLGNEVSTFELAQTLGVDRDTIARYLDVLEKAFVIFQLRAFSRNLRKEIGKKFKVYFYDLGIRNSLIANFNTMTLRTDVGALWENFCVVERMKYLQRENIHANTYFWRTHDQKEIDYIEESEGNLQGFEFKWDKETFTRPKEFLETYENSSVTLVNKKNYWNFLKL